MPRLKPVSRLEHLSLVAFSGICSGACTKVEEEAASSIEPKDVDTDDVVGLLRRLPGAVLQIVVPHVLRAQTAAVNKNRKHRGIVTAIDWLLQPSLKRLDLDALFDAGRLFGDVNARCKAVLRAGLARLASLTHLTLRGKCDDLMLFQLAANCPDLQELSVRDSDVTDAGLKALCGLSENDGGCFDLVSIDLTNCVGVTVDGGACLLRHLPQLTNLHYDRVAEAIEVVAKSDKRFLNGERTLNITRLDQFADFYDFSAHPHILNTVRSACPKLESLLFYVSDEGCKHLSELRGVKYAQIETKDVGVGFRLLTKSYSDLVFLQLTFRSMSASHLQDVANNCPRLEVLKLIGFEIADSHTLASDADRSAFSRLKVVDLRLMRQSYDDVLEDEAGEDVYAVDSVTPQLVHYVLDNCLAIEELVLQAVANFMDEAFLIGLLNRNPLTKLKTLRLSISPSTTLKMGAARYVIDALPELSKFGVNRWNITTKQYRGLLAEVKRNNYDLIIQ